MTYEVDKFWDRVGSYAQQRKGRDTEIGGDATPFNHYKRRKGLSEFFSQVRWDGKAVLELGQGSGGNLIFCAKRGATTTDGVDISEHMVALAQEKLTAEGIATKVQKTDGASIPAPDGAYDIVFCCTVLMHNKDDAAAAKLVSEMARVAREKVVIIEDMSDIRDEARFHVKRPPEWYEKQLASHGFRTSQLRSLRIQASRVACGAIARVFLGADRGRGINRTAMRAIEGVLESSALVFTRFLDPLFRPSVRLVMIEADKA